MPTKWSKFHGERRTEKLELLHAYLAAKEEHAEKTLAYRESITELRIKRLVERYKPHQGEGLRLHGNS